MKLWQFSVIRTVATIGIVMVAIQYLPNMQGIVLLLCVMAVGFTSERIGTEFGRMQASVILKECKKLRAEVAKDLKKMEKLNERQ